MPDDDTYIRRVAVKRFNACLGLLAGTWNALVLAVLIASIVAPIIETKDAISALTPQSFAIAAWCFVLHLFAYVILRFSKAE